MARARVETSIDALRKQARIMFAGKSSLYLRLSKAELASALTRGTLEPAIEPGGEGTKVRKVIVCKRCGTGGLHWEREMRDGRERFWLAEPDGARHDCDPFKDEKDEDQEPEAGDAVPVQETVPVAKPAPTAPPVVVDGDKPAARAATSITNALELLTQSLSASVDSDQVRQIATEVCRSLMQTGDFGVKTLKIEIGTLPAIEVENQHSHFPLLLALVSNRVNALLVGPAGSGKSTAAFEAARAIGLPYYMQSVGPQTSKADLVGFKNAMGEYQETPLRQAYERGGVFLLDEIDAGNPSVLTLLNALLANGHMTFGCGQLVERHADFICIAAANTYGTGADRQYVGRNQLDAATLDRFFVLEWPYDETFERALCGLPVKRVYRELKPSGYSVEGWVEFVTRTRKVIAEKNIRHVISPRASIVGAKLLNVLDAKTLEEGLVWKGLPEIQREQIRGKRA
jgi:cobaltochelatase CobS